MKRVFSDEWTVEKAILSLYFPDAAVLDRSMVKQLTQAVLLRLQGIDTTDINVPPKDRLLIKRVVELVKSSILFVDRRELPALIWIRWALRESQEPLSPDFVRDFSAWLILGGHEKLWFQRETVEAASILKKTTWRGPRRGRRSLIKHGYTVLEILTKNAVPKGKAASRLVQNGSARQELAASVSTNGSAYNQNWRVVSPKLHRNKRVLGDHFEKRLRISLREMREVDRGLFKKNSEDGKYVLEVMRKPQFIER